MEDSIIRLLLGQIVMYFYISFFSIVIIGIDNHKRLIQNSVCSKNSLAGSPRFCTVCRFCESFRKIFQSLECIFYFCDLFDSFSNYATELFFKVLTDDKYNFIESCFQRIMDRVVHNDLSIRSYRCKLFNSFSKAASNSGSHDDKCCLFHKNVLLMHIGNT